MSRSRIILNTTIGLYFLIYFELVVSPFVVSFYSIFRGVARQVFAKLQGCRSRHIRSANGNIVGRCVTLRESYVFRLMAASSGK